MPYIVRQCVEEVEKRGIEEVGIYRISGVATDIQALKAVFDASESGRPSPVVVGRGRSGWFLELVGERNESRRLLHGKTLTSQWQRSLGLHTLARHGMGWTIAESL